MSVYIQEYAMSVQKMKMWTWVIVQLKLIKMIKKLDFNDNIFEFNLISKNWSFFILNNILIKKSCLQYSQNIERKFIKFSKYFNSGIVTK